MPSVNVLSLYDKFGNFFKIEMEKRGKIYELGQEISESVERDKTIYLNGRYFSCVQHEGSPECETTPEMLKGFLGKQFYLELKAHGYGFRRKYCACKTEVPQPHQDIFRVFDGFVYRIVILDEGTFLCIDPRTVLETICSIAYLVKRGASISDLNNFPVRYRDAEGFRIDGYLMDTFESNNVPESGYACTISRYRRKEEEPAEETVPAEKVFPESRPELIQKLLAILNIYFDVVGLLRRLSFLNSRTSSKDRFAKTIGIVSELQKEIFPLEFGDFVATIDTQPIIVKL